MGFMFNDLNKIAKERDYYEKCRRTIKDYEKRSLRYH